ncbi:MAG: hypothetical protein C3F02_01540 [Parcubacteria group bacterium]|nr:MAG: hypothetical protein C3F02_01540 [Parcubacteria group bacterium]
MTPLRAKVESSQILFVSTYPPRECGIATFTQDLTQALDKKFSPLVKTKICALNEQATSIYNYNQNVVQQVAASELENYVSGANKINARSEVKLVNIQHEFGIYGGYWGNYLIPFMQALDKPIVVTLHSVLPRPQEYVRKVVQMMAARAQALVVMNRLSQKVLIQDYQIPQYKIFYIPHGIPQVMYGSGQPFKEQLGLSGKIVLSTFGLLSDNKGIQYAIRALPKIVQKYPQVVYLIIGETHPNVRKNEGEHYRNFLNKEVKRLGLSNQVKFYNKYINLEEITNFLQATDIYISTTLSQAQSVSGTLSYALGCGRPVVSTATHYAEHIITKKNGILVRFRNASDITKAVLSLLGDDRTRLAMGAQAYKDTRPMIWPNVAESYYKIYKKIASLAGESNKLPPIKLDHLVRLTDDFGVVQHARYSRPEKRFGYSTDDMARALIVCAQYLQLGSSGMAANLMRIYMKFLKFAQKKNGSFVNIVTQQRRRTAAIEDDVQGRVIWALGFVSAQANVAEDIKKEARHYFKKIFPLIKRLKAPRSMAFALCGLYYYLQAFPQEQKVKKSLAQLADHLALLYEHNASYKWHWFEDFLTYSNAKLPEALFLAYDLLRKKRYLKVAQASLKFLDSLTFGPKYFAPIGQNGWCFKDKTRAYFDQQPEDVSTMVQAKILAYKITKNKKQLSDALRAFQWFLGKNYLGLMVYDELTGGCHDGLGQFELNLNQGAESTICYLMARLALQDPVLVKLK